MKAREPYRGTWFGEKGTWLEPEELCYPIGGKHRRARAIDTVTGKLVIRWCGIPDTFFSIPCKGGGWIGSNDGVFEYHPPQPKRVEKEKEK